MEDLTLKEYVLQSHILIYRYIYYINMLLLIKLRKTM